MSDLFKKNIKLLHDDDDDQEDNDDLDVKRLKKSNAKS